MGYKIIRSIGVVLIFFGVIQASAQNYLRNTEVDALFRDSQTQGTFVVFDLKNATYTAHNPTRAEKRFVPASTFKIPNSLIGLSVGAAKNVDEVLPYGGKPQPIKSWEKDMGLRDAIKVSNVPIYQELARRIGLEQMQQRVNRLNYGNAQIGSTVDTFWLSGPLKISAIEQTQFLAKLTKNVLPFPDEIQAHVREIIKLEKGDDWTLYGKTGWAKGIGWWVGWVEKKDNIYSFAINIDMKSAQEAPKRVQLGRDSLKILGILD